MIDPSVFIHPMAMVQTGCVSIGARTHVWQFASVIRGSVIGSDCSIASCSIVDGSRLGDRVIVSHACFIDPGLCVGSDVFLGPGVAACNDGWPRAHKIGFDMDALLSGEFVTTVLGDGCSIGAGAIILAGMVIGAGAMVAAGAVVNRPVPPDMLWTRDGRLLPIDETKIQRMRRPAMEGWPGAKPA